MREEPVIHAALDELLKAWHRWQSAYTLRTGYPKTAAGCEQYRPSRQYDDQNGALDLDADIAMCEAIDAEVSRMHDPYRTAIHVEARNLVAWRVWRSPRLPNDTETVRRIVIEARAMLWTRLESAGLV